MNYFTWIKFSEIIRLDRLETLDDDQWIYTSVLVVTQHIIKTVTYSFSFQLLQKELLTTVVPSVLF